MYGSRERRIFINGEIVPKVVEAIINPAKSINKETLIWENQTFNVLAGGRIVSRLSVRPSLVMSGQ